MSYRGLSNPCPLLSLESSLTEKLIVGCYEFFTSDVLGLSVLFWINARNFIDFDGGCFHDPFLAFSTCAFHSKVGFNTVL